MCGDDAWCGNEAGAYLRILPDVYVMKRGAYVGEAMRI